ncbi:hypothetical protein [Actinoallomurus sp. CA-142502]|uniref:hypothetical protein n=1 Tax=Actinoallomurus sp. CA-142502 TaxID=3239885 RepID=UPI003D8B5F50
MEFENSVVLQVLQASHGLISPDMLAISAKVSSENVVLYFALRRKTDEVDEDVEDIIFELDALLGGGVMLEAQIYVGTPDENWPGRSCRLVYLAKNSTT